MKECIKCKKILVGFQKKFCSKSCSASYNNVGVRRHGKDPKQCLVCQKMIERRSRKYCSQKCKIKFDWNIKKQDIISEKCINTRSLKKYIIEERGHQCSICNTIEWMGQKVPLVLDHVDGNSENNLLSNLRLVCGNCDMQLPTYKNKNKGNGRASRRKRYSEGKSY